MAMDRTALACASRQIGFQLELKANRILALRDLTGAQGHMLQYILDHTQTGTSLTQIHKDFGYSKAALSAVLKQLRSKGYVRVEPCMQDDRKKLLFGTEKGRQLKAFLDRAFQEAGDQLFRDFSDPDLEELNRMQQKMLRNLAQAEDSVKNRDFDKEAITP